MPKHFYSINFKFPFSKYQDRGIYGMDFSTCYLSHAFWSSDPVVSVSGQDFLAGRPEG